MDVVCVNGAVSIELGASNNNDKEVDMELEHESTPAEPGVAATETGGPGQPAPQDSDEERLLDRIGALRRESSSDNMLLADCMQGLTGGLMDISIRYQLEITKLLNGGHSVLQEHVPLAKATNVLMGLSRQIDRYVNLIHRLKDSGRKRESERLRPRGPLESRAAYPDFEFKTESASSEEISF
jgi:hypothetical protein